MSNERQDEQTVNLSSHVRTDRRRLYRVFESLEKCETVELAKDVARAAMLAMKKGEL